MTARFESVTDVLTAEAKVQVRKLLEECKTLNILFTGKTGVGKSTLANALVGREISPEGETLDPETLDLLKYSADISGVNVTVWDCPGLQDGTNNEPEYLRLIATKCKELDLVIYCTRMDDSRMRQEDYEAITTLTKEFGEDIWKNTVFALTFANTVKKVVRSRSTAAPIDQKVYFMGLLSQWESKLKEALVRARVSQAVVDSTIIIPVGYQSDLCLPDRDNWLSNFWLACLKRINKRATLALLRTGADRMVNELNVESAGETELNSSGDELSEIFTSMTSGFITGAAVGGVVAGPAGIAFGSAAGMTAAAVSFLIRILTEDIKQKDNV